MLSTYGEYFIKSIESSIALFSCYFNYLRSFVLFVVMDAHKSCYIHLFISLQKLSCADAVLAGDDLTMA